MPVSLVGAAIVMYAFGFSLNLLTILAIVLSVGLVVDDAIVVVEHVDRRVREGKTRIQAALVRARELVGPIIAMTITLAAVYTPIGFQGGLTGSLFLEFAITLAAAVVVSRVVAITLSPVMSSRFVHDAGKEGRLTRRVQRGFAAVRRLEQRLLEAPWQKRWPIVEAAGGIAGVPAPRSAAPHARPVRRGAGAGERPAARADAADGGHGAGGGLAERQVPLRRHRPEDRSARGARRHRSRSRRRPGARPGERGPRARHAAGRRLRQPLQLLRSQLQGDSADRR